MYYIVHLSLLFSVVIVSDGKLTIGKSEIKVSECKNSTQVDTINRRESEQYVENESTVQDDFKQYHMQSVTSHAGRERQKSRKKDLFNRLLPLFIIPYLVQSALLPIILMSMKAMLVKSVFIGKLALILVAINALRSRAIAAASNKEDTKLIHQHYGYNGNEEFGAYVNN